jgi:LAO/AO transport system kinase
LRDRLAGGDLRALSRAISRVEDGQEDVLALAEALWPARAAARVVGVTGPPGAGKSTLVDALIGRFRDAGHRVAVLAVDPSSPYSGGALLGDRIRMQRHAADPAVFIRSLGTRGESGGLSRATRESAVLCAAAGFGRVVVETVGVGQTELEVAGVADQVLVLLVPESGDVVQTMKAGLLECADVFAVNKSDRAGAERLVKELRAMVEEGPAELPRAPVFPVSATEGTGISALFDEVLVRLDRGERSPRRLPARELAARLVGEESGRRAAARARAALAADGAAAPAGAALERGEANPYAVARSLLAREAE